MNHKLIIILFLFAFFKASSQADSIYAYTQTEMQKNHIPGMSIAVVKKGKLVFHQTYGWADIENSVKVTTGSPFKIASLTKPITAIAIMTLVQAGKLSLDDYLRTYLNNLPASWQTITIRQALSHTTGLGDYFQSSEWSWQHSWRLDLTKKEFIDLAAKSKIVAQPGEKMKYNNTGFYLLGLVIEQVSGKSYEQFIKDQVFEPLGMTNSRLDKAEAIITSRVKGYTWQKGELKNAEFTSDTWAYSEGGVITTAEDLAKLDSALYTDELLHKVHRELMWSPSKTNDGKPGIIGDNGAGKPNHYGLGWFISDYKNHPLLLAGGNKPGFTCSYFRFIKEDLTVIVLTNLSSAPAYSIAGKIAEMYLDK